MEDCSRKQGNPAATLVNVSEPSQSFAGLLLRAEERNGRPRLQYDEVELGHRQTVGQQADLWTRGRWRLPKQQLLKL